ncbi:MAG TPA: formylmethanofuran dehydrogenase subunit C [Vicinamibacterales bacterium]|nr:formylmethanofuran dehydrogenase subunit C [Vicinamibacterales bacterium]
MTDAATGAVVLTLKARLEAPLDMSGVTPDRCANLSQGEIAALPVWVGGRRASLGDLWTVRGERALRLDVEGDLEHVHGLGARMTDGLLHVHGNAGDDAGQAMSGGVLRVDGHAGDRLGGPSPGASRGMTGGEILVFGSAGDSAAALVRRGLVAVVGAVGAYAGRGMIAGTLLALGPVGELPGVGNKRGSIVAAGSVAVPASYRWACAYEPPHLRLLLTSLRRRFGFPCDPALLNGRFDRYCGDAGEPGKGEILVWTSHERRADMRG